jgi:hypothetical protein
MNKEKNLKFVSLLKEDSSLNVPSNKINNKSKYFSKINRHSVMHGKSMDYGNRNKQFKSNFILLFLSDWYNRYEQ